SSHDDMGSFQEVSGLETEIPVSESQKDNNQAFKTFKIPEIGQVGRITLKRGVFVKSNHFLKWYDTFKTNIIQREILTLQLVNEKGELAMAWTLLNAWPTKISGLDLRFDVTDVAVDILELAYEGLTVS
ncbi:hypothetical protein LCGC14_1421080, partial [marine sediment metagenome]